MADPEGVERVLSSTRPLQIQRSFSQESNEPPAASSNPTQSSIRKRQYVEEEIDTRSSVTLSRKSEDLTSLLSHTDWLPAQHCVFLSLLATLLSLGGDISPLWMIPALSLCSVGLFCWLKL